MVFKADLPIVQAAEAVAGVGSVVEVLGLLRRLSLMDFGLLLLSMPNPEFPALSRVLPSMAPAEVQVAWTGASGYDLFRQTKDFVTRLELYSEAICRRSLQGATILDFGCGWGRMARVMAYHTDPDRLYCLDPMPESIKLCKDHGVLGQIRLSDYLPEGLPVDDVRFDLAYAYSVFTHTSLKATHAALNTVRKYMKPDGLFVITLRPVEVWDSAHFRDDPDVNTEALAAALERDGFAFNPNAVMVNDESVYGDTTIAPQWLARTFPNWRIVRRDRGEDHLQYILVLQPC